jgi:hypothetical protein
VEIQAILAECSARPPMAAGPDSGTYNQTTMDEILRVHNKVSAIVGGGRLRLASVIECAACALGVRVAMTRDRHGHAPLNIVRIDAASKRLLRRLEAFRKRAKRDVVRRPGADAYKTGAEAWRQHVQWLRDHFLDCGCKRERRQRARGYRRLLFQRFVDLAPAELVHRRVRLPAEHTLRHYVRLAIRYVRRGRTGLSLVSGNGTGEAGRLSYRFRV